LFKKSATVHALFSPGLSAQNKPAFEWPTDGRGSFVNKSSAYDVARLRGAMTFVLTARHIAAWERPHRDVAFVLAKKAPSKQTDTAAAWDR